MSDLSSAAKNAMDVFGDSLIVGNHDSITLFGIHPQNSMREHSRKVSEMLLKESADIDTAIGELIEEIRHFEIRSRNPVLSSASVEQKIMSLKQLYSLDPDIEVICTDSCECFDNNREYLRQRAEVETNPKVRALLEQDRRMLTEMQTEMSNAREFFFVKRYTGLKPEMVFSQINDTQKRMTERGFEVRRLDRGELKRLTAIYFAASMDGDKMPDVDGGQYAGEETNGPVQE